MTSQQVVEIQKRKKLLTKVTFGRDGPSDTNIDVGILEVRLDSFILITFN